MTDEQEKTFDLCAVMLLSLVLGWSSVWLLDLINAKRHENKLQILADLPSDHASRSLEFLQSYPKMQR